MKAFTLKIKELFKLDTNNTSSNFSAEKRKLLIPLYQREFKWSDEKVTTLFNDIKKHDKFLGNIILDETTDDYQIVDGQPRITTCYMILLCLFNYYKDYPREQQALKNYIKPYGEILLQNDSVGTDEAPIEYKLSVSESPEMTNAKEYITSAPYCEVLNLKSGTDYYWTVSATDRNGNDVVSGVAVSKTSDKAPRNIFINGVRNARDVGGWTTTDGTVVKQGLMYRSGRLDQITQEGIRILHDDLKIKTEIDFRRDTEERVYEDETPIGEDVQYFRFPMEYGDYLTTNVEAIKNIFNVLSDESNYPIIYHCAAGADRTGVITYLINGLLGVPQEDLFRDFLLTNFGGHERDMSYIEGQYVKILDNYDNGQGTLQERIYKYLNNEIGVPAEQLDFVIEFLK